MDEQDEPKPVGRPSKYEPEFADDAYKHCLAGATDEDLCQIFDVARSTLCEWKLRYPEFADAIRKGKAPANAEVAYSLFRQATGYEREEEVATQAGVVTIKRYYAPTPTSTMFWLKNRMPDQWRERAEPTKVELEISFKRDATRFGRLIEQAEDEPERAKVIELLSRHPPEIREHLRLVLEGVPEDEIEEVYSQSIPTILAAASRGQGEAPTEAKLLERQEIQPDVTLAAPGFMANLDEEEEEEKARLQDAVEKVEKHNRKVRQRSKKR